jgi:hypothetical protein
MAPCPFPYRDRKRSPAPCQGAPCARVRGTVLQHREIYEDAGAKARSWITRAVVTLAHRGAVQRSR